MPEPEGHVVSFDDLEHTAHAHEFVGAEHGDVPFSIILVHSQPGVGPKLHRHPYAEVFVVEAGQATFRIGERTLVIDEGHVVVSPPGEAHGFTNTGLGRAPARRDPRRRPVRHRVAGRPGSDLDLAPEGRLIEAARAVRPARRLAPGGQQEEDRHEQSRGRKHGRDDVPHGQRAERLAAEPDTVVGVEHQHVLESPDRPGVAVDRPDARQRGEVFRDRLTEARRDDPDLQPGAIHRVTPRMHRAEPCPIGPGGIRPVIGDPSSPPARIAYDSASSAATIQANRTPTGRSSDVTPIPW